MDRVSIRRIGNNITINLRLMRMVNDDELIKNIKELIKDAIKDGFSRVNLVVITDRSFGYVIKLLGMVLKEFIYPSISLWLVKDEDEVNEVLRVSLGDIYGKGL